MKFLKEAFKKKSANEPVKQYDESHQNMMFGEEHELNEDIK